MNKLLIMYIFLVSSCSTYQAISLQKRNTASGDDASFSCKDAIQSFTENILKIDEAKFNEYYEQLNLTLSGNLATVYRSEWKAKESYQGGAEFLESLIKNYGDYSLEDTKNLSGVDKINKFVSLLKEKRRIKAIGMRDPPAPKGSKDKTFTYYTKSIIDGTGGKHQVRLRTYIRTLIPAEMKVDLTVKGYFDGNIIDITKLKSGLFSFTKRNMTDEVLTSSELTLNQLKVAIGNNLTFYAYPHAKNYKLEIKSTPKDEIKLARHVKLMGKNYVQKLSIDIGINDLSLLFKSANDLRDMESKLKILKNNSFNNPLNSRERIIAIFKILEESNISDPDFLKAQGATQYSRHAFEIEVPDTINGEKVKIQTTFDYDMSISKNYNSDGFLLTPVQSVTSSVLKVSPHQHDKLHIELKVPKVLIEQAETGSISAELEELLKLYSDINVTNKGKFNYIQSQ